MTRTFGAHSTARVWVRLTSPAFAAPYAAVPGEGRRPLSEPTVTIAPPSSWPCMTRLAAVATLERGQQVEGHDRGRELGRRRGRFGLRRAADVGHGDVEPAVVADDGGDQLVHLVGLPHVRGEEAGAGGQLVGLVASADGDLGAGGEQARR